MQGNQSVEAGEYKNISQAGRKVTAYRIGLVIFCVGTLYMIVASVLATWWVVPTMREIGLHNFGEAVLLWAVSVPLGSLLIALGGALMASDRRLWFWVAATVAIVFWLSSGPITEILSPLFGIAGGFIMFFFLGIAWNWVKVRSQLSAAAQKIVDLQMIGYVFFIIAAWNLCGLLGAPIFALRPSLSQQFNVEILAISLGSTVLICLTIGWGLHFMSHYLTSRQTQAQAITQPFLKPES